MSKTTIQMAFDAEKLNAVKLYMGKKNADLESEFAHFMQKVYEDYVPAPVREYIESRLMADEPKPKSQKLPRPRPQKGKPEIPQKEINDAPRERIEVPLRESPELPVRSIRPASVPFTAPEDE
ncbi:MAG: DUF6103 family protein [Oscillospiraceae bacterium]|nr:DUF6103 family protein [Oscillospiraceae bacterium]